MREIKTIAGLPVPSEEDQIKAINELFPPKPPRPPPRTLYDNLPAGVSDPGTPPPPLKLPEPVVFNKPRQPDEEIPAFGTITRVSYGDLNLLLSRGLLTRLIEAFPAINPTAWATYLQGPTTDNTCFFRKTEHVVVMAISIRDFMSGKMVVRLTFLFSFDRGPEGGIVPKSPGERESLHLLRELRDWAKMMNAAQVEGLGGKNCDLNMHTIQSNFRTAAKVEDLVIKL